MQNFFHRVFHQIKEFLFCAGMTFHGLSLCVLCFLQEESTAEQEGDVEGDAIGWRFFYSRWLLFALNINFFWDEKAPNDGWWELVQICSPFTLWIRRRTITQSKSFESYSDPLWKHIRFLLSGKLKLIGNWQYRKVLIATLRTSSKKTCKFLILPMQSSVKLKLNFCWNMSNPKSKDAFSFQKTMSKPKKSKKFQINLTKIMAMYRNIM